MGREPKNIYCFISDENKKFYTATQLSSGDYSIISGSSPKPIKYNPSNLLDSELEFATNNKYMSMVRSITFPLEFVKDGAAILRHLYFLRKGIVQDCYLTIIEWNGYRGIYELSYYGKIDFSQSNKIPKTGSFIVPIIDDSAWGVLSNNDEVVYAIECNKMNNKAVRVLFDGVTLENTYTFQTVLHSIVGQGLYNTQTIACVLTNQSGDGYGIIAKSQSYNIYNSFDELFKSGNFLFESIRDITGVLITGIFSYRPSINHPYTNGQFTSIYFITSLGTRYYIVNNVKTVIGKTYNIPLNFNINLASGEKLFLFSYFENPLSGQYTLNINVDNIYIKTKTVTDSIVRYGIRAIDLLQQVSLKATNNRFSVSSEFLTSNNKDVCISGDSIRNIGNAKIYTSFFDLFKTLDCIYFLALRSVNGDLWLEKADDVYNPNSGNIVDLGDAIDVTTSPATEYYCNEIEVGSPKQDYRHPSGRLEFNSTNTFSLNIKNVNRKLDLVSRYRLGCFDIVFMILDYQGQSTKDNTGDTSVYLVKITDELGYGSDDIENFENINVNNSPLNPIIKSPINNAVIPFNKPTIKGISLPGNTVNIYVDNVLDGSTVADANGNWVYNINTALTVYIPSVETGIHIIEATFTDLSAPKDTITVTLDTTVPMLPTIIYPDNGDGLYNNKPLLKGFAPAGTNIDISLDGVIIASVVTDNSCIWTYKVNTPIPNGSHTISINAGIDSVAFDVDSFTSLPLLTYIGSELDGFVIFNNLPLIEGVATPGTSVKIWLNYNQYAYVGTAIADANGNWSYQTVPVYYNDPVTGIPVELVPIRNGVSTISTDLVAHVVQINVSGYKLSRPLYSLITGVTDNTVFNTEYTSARMIMARKSLFSAMLQQQPNEYINFQTADKNSNFSTVLNGVSIRENANIPFSSLGQPIALLENATIKVNAKELFAKSLYNFSNGGVITCNFRGNQLYFLPIGGMKISSIKSSVQEWKLLFSPNTTFQTLLNLHKQGTTINLMKNAIFHSDYNSLHAVKYDFTKDNKYHTIDIYEDWFSNRNSFWLLNPEYIQKYQKTESFRDQIITNGVTAVTLKMYRCSDASLVDTILYNAVANPPIPPPDVILEANIDLSIYDEGQYFFAMFVGSTPVMIFERIDLREVHERTILIEASNSINMVGAYFSTGFKTVSRVDGIVKKLQFDIKNNTAEFENGDSELLYSLSSKANIVRFGDARGMPDYKYLRIINSILLDNLFIENIQYTLPEGEEVKQSEEVSGHPLFYYEVKLFQKTHTSGLTVSGGTGGVVDGVVLVVDATAFGLPQGSLIDIEVQ